MPEETKKHILVAEDDKFYGQIFNKELTKAGYSVDVVVNGKLALESAQKKKPNLIILDLVMPVMDGFEALEELKKDEALKAIKVIVISNLGQDSDKEKAKKLGAVDYFVKANISIKDVLKLVEKHL